MSASDPIPSPKGSRPHRRLSLTLPTQAPGPPIDQASAGLPVEPEVALANPTSAEPPLPGLASAEVLATTSGTSATGTGAAATTAATTRVMAYLTPDEAKLLDEMWFSRRSTLARPSKSDILRAALALASRAPDDLDVALAEQQSSTLSRQRDSKVPYKRSSA